MSKNDDFSTDCYSDVPKTSSRATLGSGGLSSSAAKQATSSKVAYDEVLAFDRIYTSLALAPIIIDFDITASNLEFVRIVYDKFKSFWGQIIYPGKQHWEIEEIDAGKAKNDVIPYLTSFEVLMGYIGDAVWDRYPIQRSEFCRGEKIYDWMKKMNLEGGGGGNYHESFELGAFDIEQKCEIPKAETPFYFLPCDEMPYDSLKNSEVKQYVKRDFHEKLSTKEVYRRLFKKFKGNVFILQNPYFGRTKSGKINHPEKTKEITAGWKEILPSEYQSHLLMLHEEKSLVDVMLGIIARSTGARDKTSYTADMESKEQSKKRIENVNRTISFLDNLNAGTVSLPDNDDVIITDVGSERIA